MPDPSSLRDSTQIVLPIDVLDELRQDIEDRFTVTIFPIDDRYVRIIGSPVEIKDASEFLARNGVHVP